MKIEVRSPNEDWGCALYKGAHYPPTNTVPKIYHQEMLYIGRVPLNMEYSPDDCIEQETLSCDNSVNIRCVFCV